MTNNSNQTPSNQTSSSSAQTQNKKAPERTDNARTQTASPNRKTSNTTNNSVTAAKAADLKVKQVDIAIAGVTYSIFCPEPEEEELRAAVHYINNFALDIKKGAPSLSQENLLVLSCLNLYEKIHEHNKTDDNQQQESKQTEALLSKIIQDTQSIL
jgi:cell division protein ZapA